MAENNLKIIWVPFGEVGWLPRHNVERMEPWIPGDERKRSKLQLMQSGWDINQGFITVERADEALATEAATRYQELYDNYCSTKFQLEGLFGHSDFVRAWEMLRFSNGKLIPIKYIAHCGFCRSEVIPMAAAASLRAGQEVKVGMIPIYVRSFNNDLERWEVNMAENRKTVGFDKPPFPSLVNAAVKLIEVGLKEAEVTRLLGLKRGTGQKVFALATLCGKYEGMVNALVTGTVDGSKLDKEELRRLVKEDAASGEVESYVKGTSASKTTRAVDKPSMVNIAKNNKHILIADVCACLADGDKAELSKWDPAKEAINEAIRTAMATYNIKLHVLKD